MVLMIEERTVVARSFFSRIKRNFLQGKESSVDIFSLQCNA